MKKETLISLSLAGAIGYYLYNKLQQFDGNVTTADSSADARTAEELSWRPDPIIEEPVVEQIVVEETIEEPQIPVVEEIVEEPVVEDDVLNPLAAFPFSDTYEEPTAPVAPVVEEVYEDPTAWTCSMCNTKNPETSKFCNECGAAKPAAFVEEPMQMIEPDDQINIAGVDDDDMTNVDDLFGEIEKEDPVVEAPAAPIIETPVARVEPKIEEPVYTAPAAPVVETPTFEPAPFVAPSLDDIKIEEPEFAFPELPKQEAPKAEPVAPAAPTAPVAPVVEPTAAPVQEKKLMENTEPLHKVDAKSKSAKDEYQSILDFINTL